MGAITFEKPSVVGKIDPAILAQLQQSFPEETSGANWYRDSYIDPYVANPNLLEILGPLTELVLGMRNPFHSRPSSIQYSVDTRTAQPGLPQRRLSWHLDTGASKCRYLVASVLPTEFLVENENTSDERYRARRASIVSHLASTFDLSEYPSAEMIDAAGLRVYAPDCCDIVRITEHIHRSTINTSNDPVFRVWVRASIMNQQSDYLR